MAKVQKFEELKIWQVAREVAKRVYELTRWGEFAKDYGLKDQIQRAAVSIGSNIAEGFERRGNKEFIKFLWIAKGSAAEVASQLYHAKDLGYITDEVFTSMYNKTKQIGGMIFKLIATIGKTKGSSYVRA